MSSRSSSNTDSSNFKAGHLKKKGVWGKWKEGWYEISNGILYQYSNQKDILQATNEYDLKGCTVHAAENLTGLKNTFLLVLSDKKKQIFFQAGSLEDCADWIEIIQTSAKYEEGKNTSFKSRYLLEAFNEAVVLTDEKSNILDMNSVAQDLFGWRLEEVIGKSVSIFMPVSTGQVHGAYVDKYNQTGEKRLIGKPRKMKALHRDGKIIPILLSLGEIVDDGPKKYIATIKDLSETEVVSEKMNEEIDKQINELCLSLKEKLHEVAKDVAKTDEQLKLKLEEIRNQNKELKNQLRDVTLQLQLEQSSHNIISNALYSVIRAGLNNKQDVNCPMAICKKLIEEEIQKNKSPNILFREDNENIRKILAIFSFEGAFYLVYTLQRPMQKLLTSTQKKKELNSNRLTKYSSFILDAILLSDKNVPETFKELFHFIKDQMVTRNWNEYKLIIGGLLVLRFFTPVVIAPMKHGLITEQLDDYASRVLLSISKILMVVASDSPLPEDLQALQPFVNNKAKEFEAFIGRIVDN